MKSINLFPTLMKEYDLTDSPGLDAFKKVIFEKGQTSVHGLAVNGRSSHGGFDPLNFEESMPMLQSFMQCLDDYTTESGNWPTIISGSWYNILPKGGFTHRHRHESSVISGAFYVTLPDGDHGNFYVLSPLQPYMMCMHHIQTTPYSTYEFDVDIKENHLYLFPSWLEHGSRENNTDKDRVTVSFNTNPMPPDRLDPNFVEQIWGKGHEDS